MSRDLSIDVERLANRFDVERLCCFDVERLVVLMSRDLTAGQRDKWHWDGMGRLHGMGMVMGMGQEQETVGNICDVERLTSTDVERLSFTLAYSVCSHVERLLGMGMGWGFYVERLFCGGVDDGVGIYVIDG